MCALFAFQLLLRAWPGSGVEVHVIEQTRFLVGYGMRLGSLDGLNLIPAPLRPFTLRRPARALPV